MSTADPIHAPAGVLRGRTALTARALQRLATGVAKDAAGVSSRDVTVSLSDDSGALRVAVAVPVVIAVPAVTIPDQGARLRSGLIAGLGDLAGRRVSAVDVRFAGVRDSAERRVR